MSPTNADEKHSITRTQEQTPETVMDEPPPPFEIRHKPSRPPASIEIYRNSDVLYYIRSYIEQDHPDLVLHAGCDSKGPQIALMKFVPFSKDFKYYIGDLRTPSSHDWDIVHSADGERRGLMGVFGSGPSMDRFESVVGSAASANGQSRERQKLYWQKTSESKLGASSLSRYDYKLVDESSETVVAVYLEQGVAKMLGPEKGMMKFHKRLDDTAELAALMVLVGLLESSEKAEQANGCQWICFWRRHNSMS